MSTSPRTEAQRPRTKAQQASDANKIQQYAVRTNTSRPSDRKVEQKQLQNDHPNKR